MPRHLKAVNGSGRAELPQLTTYEDLERRFAHLDPADRLKAYLNLPAWERAEADLDLRARLDEFREDDLEEPLEMAA